MIAPMKNETPQKTVALLPWGNVIEDFLQSINLTLDDFCNEMTGGWLFGYIEALKLANVKTVLVCISATIAQPTRKVHQPTGAIVWILPVPRLYLPIHRRMKDPYGWTVDAAWGENLGVFRPVWSLLREIAPYLCTPLPAVAQALKAENCQAILCQEYEYARFDLCVLLGKYLNMPVYASFQGGDFQVTNFEKLWRPWAIRASQGLVVATTGEISRLQKHYGVSSSKIAQIFNPLDTRVWQGGDRSATRAHLHIPQEALVVVWHGRVDLHRKGLDILVAAWSQILTRSPTQDLRLLLVGTGDDATALSQQIERLALPRVHWINDYILDRARICNYLKAADVYVLPSRHEGFPVAPLEAMACGLPVVATEVPGIPDILELGEESGGIRVPCENIDELAYALERLLGDPDLRRQLGQRAKQRVEEKFSLLAVGQEMRTFLVCSQSSLH